MEKTIRPTFPRWALGLSLGCLAWAAPSPEPPRRGRQWTMTEWAFDVATDVPGNTPYLSAGVTAEFTGPAQARLRVRGFWDGGSRWRLRFTPPSAGRWTFVTQSTLPGLDGRTGVLEASPRRPTDKGFLVVPPDNPRGFRWQNGEGFFMAGNTLYNLSANAVANGPWKEALAASRQLGLNKVRFQLGRIRDERDPKDAFPVSSLFDGPDQDRLNLPHWQKLDQVVAEFARQDMVAELIVFQRDRVDTATREQNERLLRYAIARYAAYPNVIWCLMNEWEYTKHPAAYWQTLGRLAREEDPYWPRLLGIHQQTRYDYQLFRHEDRRADWWTHAIVQFGVRNRGKLFFGGDEWKARSGDRQVRMSLGDDWGAWSIDFNRRDGRPVVNDEYGYIGEPKDDSESPAVVLSREKHRRILWSIVMAGGGFSAGHKTTFPDAGAPYFSAIWRDAPEWGDVRILLAWARARGFADSQPEPAPELIVEGQRLHAARLRRGVAVYAAAGGPGVVAPGPGPWRWRRLDPRTGQVQDLGWQAGERFTVPAQAPQDWVYWAEKR